MHFFVEQALDFKARGGAKFFLRLHYSKHYDTDSPYFEVLCTKKNRPPHNGISQGPSYLLELALKFPIKNKVKEKLTRFIICRDEDTGAAEISPLSPNVAVRNACRFISHHGDCRLGDVGHAAKAANVGHVVCFQGNWHREEQVTPWPEKEKK